MGQCCAKIMGEELGRRDSYRGAVKDTKKMAEADAAADSSKGGKKAAGKEKMEDLKKELTLDDHIITWEEFHVRHEGSNRVSGLTESKAAEILERDAKACVVHGSDLKNYGQE